MNKLYWLCAFIFLFAGCQQRAKSENVNLVELSSNLDFLLSKQISFDPPNFTVGRVKIGDSFEEAFKKGMDYSPGSRPTIPVHINTDHENKVYSAESNVQINFRHDGKTLIVDGFTFWGVKISNINSGADIERVFGPADTISMDGDDRVYHFFKGHLIVAWNPPREALVIGIRKTIESEGILFF